MIMFNVKREKLLKLTGNILNFFSTMNATRKTPKSSLGTISN